MSEFTADTALHGHTTEATAYLVEDYPYGFRERTSIRYWLETTSHGDRLLSQTLNPKTGRWNKPKKSVYMDVACMFLNADGHVKHTGIGVHANDEWLAKFLEVMEGRMTPAQKTKLAGILGMRRAFEGITFTVVANGVFTPAEAKDQARIEAHLARRVTVETALALEALEAAG